MTLPPRIYVLPDSTLPGVGSWTDTNDGSMAMEGAVEYVPASAVAKLKAALYLTDEDCIWLPKTAITSICVKTLQTREALTISPAPPSKERPHDR